MVGDSFRVRRLREAIAIERRRQNECRVQLGQTHRHFTNCKQSQSYSSVIEIKSTVGVQRATRAQCDWQSRYQLERGDWEAPVQVHILCYRSDASEQVRRQIAASRIATWCWRQKVRYSVEENTVEAIQTQPIKRMHKVKLVNPTDMLERIKQEIEMKVRLQIETRAVKILHRFFVWALYQRTKNNRDERIQRLLSAEHARKMKTHEQCKRDRAARFIQSMYRNKTARQQHNAWKTSRSKANYCRILILELEYNQAPSSAALLNLSKAYLDFSIMTIYQDQHIILSRLSLLYSSKAIAFGFIPDEVFWLDIGERFVKLWKQDGHVEIVLLQQAAQAYEKVIQKVKSLTTKAWLAYINILFQLGLYCQVIKACNQYIRSVESIEPRRRRCVRHVAIWRYQCQSYFHLGDYEAAAGLLEDQIQDNTHSDDIYTRNQLLLMQARCQDLMNRSECAMNVYDQLLNALHTCDEIIRLDLQPSNLRENAEMFLQLGLHCSKHRDYPWAVDLLQYALNLLSVEMASPTHLAALAHSSYGVGNEKKCREFLLLLHGVDTDTFQWYNRLQAHATAFENEHRISVLKVREYFHVQL
ncbi:hypothetical protein THRCLA_07242 [Thraustotheca clavata]|uniref:Uncharacterized protein n=1 Tax=Thraustotheca clavata TaxID=74557 RepID=A0A1V9ZF17_9STRA|nr:hypothetical protein THRCLA_07242 [Thraustotheca clavata]